MNGSLTCGLSTALQVSDELYIRQKREWGEVLLGFESANKYVVMNADKQEIGMVAEKSSGFWAVVSRSLLRSHRPLQVDVVDLSTGQTMMMFQRRFFFFFSDLSVFARDGRMLGSIHRRFGFIYKKYDLKDEHSNLFATIKSPMWRLWTFPVFNLANAQIGEIAKKWGGALREIFTDADTFRVTFGRHSWSEAQRAVVFAAAVSIDFDFFEDNSGE